MQLLFDAAYAMAVFTLASLGLFVILGLMNIINLAHASFMALSVYSLLTAIGRGVGFLLAAAVALCATLLVGAIVERLVVRRLYGRHIDDTILATWGISLILVQALTLVYGRTTMSVPLPLPGSVFIAGEPFSLYRIFVIGSAVALVALLAAITRFTRVGLVVRMVMTNERLARAAGVDSNKVRQITFLAGAGFAGVAGILLAPTQGITPSFAMSLLAPTFLIVLMSGKSLIGLLVGCAFAGMIQTIFGTYSTPVLAHVMVVCFAVLVLRAKPEGLVWRPR
jgi:branched-chain amino acid transport system permease protein